MRRFIAVPEGATWAEMRIRAGQTDTPKVGEEERATPVRMRQPDEGYPGHVMHDRVCAGMCPLGSARLPAVGKGWGHVGGVAPASLPVPNTFSPAKLKCLLGSNNHA